MAMVGEAVPREKTGRALGLLGTMSALGTAFGPTFGGLLIDHFGWSAAFFINVPFGVVAMGLVHGSLSEDGPRLPVKRAAFDRWGTLVLAMTTVTYALSMTTGRGKLGPLNGILLLLTAAGAGLFLRVEARVASPLVQPRLLGQASLRNSLLASAIVSTVMMATLVVGPFYLAKSLGLGKTAVGVALSVGPLVAALSGYPAGRLVDRFGSLRASVGGLAAMVAGCAVLSILPMSFGIIGYLAPVVVVTSGYAIFQAANNTDVLRAADSALRGVLSGLLNLSRNLGLITGASVMGTIFAIASGAEDVVAANPEAIATGMRTTVAVAAALLFGTLVITSRTAGGSVCESRLCC
jgi:MFS family permease